MLLALPGGFAEAGYRVRDRYLRWVANRRGIHVPSLVADRRIETGEDQQHIIADAEHHVEEVGAGSARGWCAVMSDASVCC